MANAMHTGAEMFDNVSPEAKRTMLVQKLALWHNTTYDASIDAKVAQMLNNEPLLQAAAKRMAEALKAEEYIQGLLEAFGPEGEPGLDPKSAT